MSIQYSILLCITTKISNLEPGIQDKIIAISVQNICGRFIAFLSLILYISLLCCRFFVWYFCFSKRTRRSGRGNEVYLAAIFMKVTHWMPVQALWWEVCTLTEFSKWHKLFALKCTTSLQKIFFFNFIFLPFLSTLNKTHSYQLCSFPDLSGME